MKIIKLVKGTGQFVEKKTDDGTVKTELMEVVKEVICSDEKFASVMRRARLTAELKTRDGDKPVKIEVEDSEG